MFYYSFPPISVTAGKPYEYFIKLAGTIHDHYLNIDPPLTDSDGKYNIGDEGAGKVAALRIDHPGENETFVFSKS